jgi:capsular exopolysaccharide synthesis family protein
VKSTGVATAAATRLGGTTTPGALIRHVTVKSIKDSPTLQITYEAGSPVEAQRGATAFANAYLANRGQQARVPVETQLGELRTKIDLATTEVHQLVTQIAAARKGTTEYLDARRSLRDVTFQLQSLRTQLSSVELQNTDPGQVIQAAKVPARPSSPNPPLDIGVAIFLGLAVAIGAALVRDRVDQHIRDRSALEAALGAPLLGTIPPTAAGDGGGTVLALRDPAALAVEAFRTLRASVMSSFPEGGTLMIASSLPNEGKSTIAANLAVVLAQADKDVVLISADMRKPRMHELFGVSNERGLSSLLARAVSPLTCLVATESPRLVLCPAGPVPSNPAELLQSERMLELVKTFRRTADFVVFDCPPVLAVSDSLGLVPMADSVIFVVDARSTNRLAVREAAYRLEQVGTRILGGVLNKQERSLGGYGYGYGYGYGPTPPPPGATAPTEPAGRGDRRAAKRAEVKRARTEEALQSPPDPR